jgi:hypothetical protein
MYLSVSYSIYLVQTLFQIIFVYNLLKKLKINKFKSVKAKNYLRELPLYRRPDLILIHTNLRGRDLVTFGYLLTG